MSKQLSDDVRRYVSRTSGMNQAKFGERLEVSEPIQRWIRAALVRNGVPHEGRLLTDWKQCGTHDDVFMKRDLYCDAEGGRVYVQSKHRQPDSGSDMQIALIQPYPGLPALKRMIAELGREETNRRVIGRDYRFDGQYFAVMSNLFETVRVYRADLVKGIVRQMMKEWFEDGVSLSVNGQKCFDSVAHPGAELRCFRDEGRGSHDSGVLKILAYVPHALLQDRAVAVFPAGEPPVEELGTAA